jgi:hypothetical protein
MSESLTVRVAVARARARIRTASDLSLALRMLGWAAALRVLKHWLPLDRLVRLVHRGGGNEGRDRAREDQIVTFARWISGIVRASRAGNCLERGLLAYRFLGGANASPTLVVGVARAEQGDGIRGHAWVLVDGQPAGESLASLGDFTVIVTFDAAGRPISATDARPLSRR